MLHDPHGTGNIPIGTPVVGHDGRSLGRVREVHPHYVLVGEEGQHEDLDVPVHAIVGLEQGTLRVSITRASATAVDDVETAQRLLGESPDTTG
jgi:hypothetical protein